MILVRLFSVYLSADCCDCAALPSRGHQTHQLVAALPRTVPGVAARSHFDHRDNSTQHFLKQQQHLNKQLLIVSLHCPQTYLLSIVLCLVVNSKSVSVHVCHQPPPPGPGYEIASKSLLARR